MAYTRVNGQDTPDKSTPLSAKNLNTMDVAIANLDSTMTQVRSEANGARLYAEDANTLALENQGRLDNLDTTIEQIESNIDGLISDQGDNFITFLSITTAGVAITPVMQHTVKIGPLFFVHFSFKLTSSTAGTEMIASLPAKARPLHTHTFACVSASPSAVDMHAMVGRVNTDGSIGLEGNKSSTTSGAYVFDAEFFYCTDH